MRQGETRPTGQTENRRRRTRNRITTAADAGPDTSSGAVSGRYEGETTVRSSGKSFLELRIDIDERFPNSPVTNRVSGDLYQLNTLAIPGKPTASWKAFSESWVVEQPQVEYARDYLEITGPVRSYKNNHPNITIRIHVSRSLSQPPEPAEVSLIEQGGLVMSYTCRKTSEHFRELKLDVAYCTSSGPAILPSFDTHGDDDRPSDLARRVLTIEEAYREAGVHMTVGAVRTAINDANHTPAAWSDAQLHRTMLQYYKGAASGWPKWELWGFIAGEYVQPSVGGIMFDAAILRGETSNSEPDRRGFAVFRKHPWFSALNEPQPTDREGKAKYIRAQRQLLYTWVHEAGHAFNFVHSWDKNRTDSLSWMNYDWRYEHKKGPGSFWSNFRFRFDDEELIHLRHGDRSSVIMGGDPWSAGAHIEAPPAAVSKVEGQPPLEITLGGQPYFEFMEPVLIEACVRNLVDGCPIDIDPRFNPEHGRVVYFIRRPDGRIVEYAPILCKLSPPERLELKPARKGHEGEDRFRQEVFLSYGQYGFYFDRPGDYQIRALYHGLGDVVIPSNVLRIRIGHPCNREIDIKAQDYFTPGVGILLYLYGSRSTELDDEWQFLMNLAEDYKESMLGVRLSLPLANSLLRPASRLVLSKNGDINMESDVKPDPEMAIRITDPARDYLRKQTRAWVNLAYLELINRRVEGLMMADRKPQADKEYRELRGDLKKRGVNDHVLREISRKRGRL